ncbi:MAG: hypothetical protein C3F11_17310 [Methylocystaceae bacterium]|nr:MAG: hypothetical protein C3F11_17310 [Methylocystaceae bacterium]
MSETGWHSQRKENARLAGRMATRNARRRALRRGEATPILLRGRKIAPDAQEAIDKFMQKRKK